MNPSINLQMIDLSVEHSDAALFSDLNFTVKNQELWQIVGANGTGKSTLLRMAAGLRKSTSGEVRWQGAPLNEDYQQQIIYIGHLNGLRLNLTVVENIHLFCLLSPHANSSAACIQKILQTLNLWAFKDLPAALLSAGQKRKLALARLKLQPALLWMLDEPFTALDEEGKVILKTWLTDFIKTQGSVLIASHEPCLPNENFTRVIELTC